MVSSYSTGSYLRFRIYAEEGSFTSDLTILVSVLAILLTQ
jgi:hypothetical protein